METASPIHLAGKDVSTKAIEHKPSYQPTDPQFLALKQEQDTLIKHMYDAHGRKCG